MKRPSLAASMVAGSLVLAGGSGFLTSQALGTGKQTTRTVTINVATGAQGPAGPVGPAGPPGPKGDPGPQGPGGLTCPTDYEAGQLVINHPGGQTILWTCIHN